jgi:proton glutamate symport protein
MKKYSLLIATALCFALMQSLSLFNLDVPVLAIALRWIGVVCMLMYAYNSKSLTWWIFAALIGGAVFGYDFKDIAVHLKILSDIFLKLIKCIIAPLLISTLVVGIAGHSDIKQVGRMGLKAIIYFEVVTTLALIIGLAAINFSKAGVGLKAMDVAQTEIPKVAKQDAKDIILHIFPENIAKSVADGQILQIVVFAVLLGIGLAMVNDEKKKPLLNFMESVSEAMFKFTNVVMYAAPIGVFGAIAFTISKMGIDVLGNLLQLLGTLYAALVVLIVGVFIPILLLLKIKVKDFWNAVREPFSIAFATASSEAALPLAMERMVEFGVSRKVVSFVLPTGYSFNLDGTTLYLALASVFVAQAAGIDLSIGQQLLIVFTLMLTSKGVAGVPRASLVILLGTMSSFNLPDWPVYIILGIDTLMDMARTAVNVTGNCLASVVVAKWEGEFKKEGEVLSN